MITHTIEEEITALKKAIQVLEKKHKQESWNWEVAEQLTFVDMILTLKSSLSRLEKQNVKPTQKTLF